MEITKIEELEYRALQAEKRDRMNARLQVWSLFFGLVGAFGLAGLQSGVVGYLIAVYPFLAACLARYVAHSERVLDQLKVRLLALEEKSGFVGYEHLNQAYALGRRSGSHAKAFRDALIITQVLAAAMAVHLSASLLLQIGVILAEWLAVVATIVFLRERSIVSGSLRYGFDEARILYRSSREAGAERTFVLRDMMRLKSAWNVAVQGKILFLVGWYVSLLFLWTVRR